MKRVRTGLGVLVVAIAVATSAVFLAARHDEPVAVRSASGSTDGLPPSASSGPVKEPRNYGRRGRLEPPNASPRISAEEAWQAYQKAGLFPSCDGPDLDVRFGLYTDNEVGDLQPSGDVRRAIARMPAWIVTCSNVRLRPAGPGSNGISPSDSVSTLDAVVVVDSFTGEVVLGYTTEPGTSAPGDTPTSPSTVGG